MAPIIAPIMAPKTFASGICTCPQVGMIGSLGSRPVIAKTSAASTAIVPRAAETKWPGNRKNSSASSASPKTNSAISSQPANPATK